jgi:hypothetical protein
VELPRVAFRSRRRCCYLLFLWASSNVHVVTTFSTWYNRISWAYCKRIQLVAVYHKVLQSLQHDPAKTFILELHIGMPSRL